MKKKVSTRILKKVSLLTASIGFVFIAHAQTQTETQEFVAQGSDTNPAVLTINIPNDITVNNGENIENIEVSLIEEDVTIDLSGIPIPVPTD